MSKPLPKQNIRLLKLMKQALEQNLLRPSYKPLLQVRFPTRKSFQLGCDLQTSAGQLISYSGLEKLAHLTQTGGELDRWLLERGLEALKRLHREEAESLLVIPQSTTALSDPEYPQRLERQKELKELSLQGLVIAFRLSAISKNLKQAHQCFIELHEMGVETMIEGFNHHPAAVKILHALGSRYVSVSESLQRAEDGVVEHRIKTCHQLGVRILLAEVNGPDKVNLHWSAGADLLAGNYIQPPIRDIDFRFPPVII